RGCRGGAGSRHAGKNILCYDIMRAGSHGPAYADPVAWAGHGPTGQSCHGRAADTKTLPAP
ncbi:hypothetical protein, partial [Novacetimonas hansenii]